MSPVITETLRIARGELGVRESPSNWGPQVQSYLASVEIRFPAAWCGAFVWWCVSRAAQSAKRPEVLTAFDGITPRQMSYCPYVHEWARREGILRSAPAPGDFFLSLRSNGRARHIGFVESVAGGRFQTLEGNSNNTGSAEGNQVCSNSRNSSGAYAFVRWAELLDGALTPAPAGATRKLILSSKTICDMPVVDGRCLAPVRVWLTALGFGTSQIRWDDGEVSIRMPHFQPRALDVDITMIGEHAYAPIRQLAAEAGLIVRLERDLVHVERP